MIVIIALYLILFLTAINGRANQLMKWVVQVYYVLACGKYTNFCVSFRRVIKGLLPVLLPGNPSRYATAIEPLIFFASDHPPNLVKCLVGQKNRIDHVNDAV
jgi:hypothetical protein